MTVGGFVVRRRCSPGEVEIQEGQRVLVAKVGCRTNDCWVEIHVYGHGGRWPDGSTSFAATGAPLTITEICAVV